MPTHLPPDGFLWGVATAGHQTEGNNVTSDTWYLEHTTPSAFREPSGQATNSWELWRDDLALVHGMGLNAFRFSVEWARIEPEEGEFSEAALDHYESIINECIALGLAPIVTFNHFTAPHWFAKQGGWLSDTAPATFARFCGVVMERFGDRIAIAITLNEPNLPRLLEWADLPGFVAELTRATLEAATTATGVERYRAANVMLPEEFGEFQAAMTAAHVAARDTIKKHRPELPVGLSIAIADDVAVPGGEQLRDRKRAEVYDHWLRLAADDDFIGVQNYERVYYGPDGKIPTPDGAPVNDMGSAVEPGALRGAVEYSHQISGRPVLVSEHGISTPDDSLRSDLIEPAIEDLLAAVATGVPVLGYVHWTLMDNFEWYFGYSVQLGLVSVDRTTFERTLKPSARVYSSLVRRLTLHPGHLTEPTLSRSVGTPA